jgi:hypothetical protein
MEVGKNLYIISEMLEGIELQKKVLSSERLDPQLAIALTRQVIS